MLTRLIVDLYTWLLGISLWFMLLISAVVGYRFTVPVLSAAGWILENEAAWRMLGALLAAVAAFLVSAILTGPFLVLVDIRRSVRSLEAKYGGYGIGVLHTERREPSL
jgi:hypothetical protein